MDSSVSLKDEIWFLRVCHHILTGLYILPRKYATSYSGPSIEHVCISGVRTTSSPSCFLIAISITCRLWGHFRRSQPPSYGGRSDRNLTLANPRVYRHATLSYSNRSAYVFCVFKHKCGPYDQTEEQGTATACVRETNRKTYRNHWYSTVWSSHHRNKADSL